MPQQPVGGRFQSVVDCVERVQRRRGGAVPENFALVPGLGGDDGARLRHQGSQVGRRPRRNEEREYHAGQRGVEAARVDERPERDAEQDVRRAAVDARPVQKRERHDHRGGRGKVARMDLAGVEQRDDDDRRRCRRRWPPRSGRCAARPGRAAPSMTIKRDRERGVGRHRHAPAVRPRARRDDQRSRAAPARPCRRARPRSAARRSAGSRGGRP